MKAIDQVLVEGQGEQFALLAPEVINDYVETLGKPCQNPLGYTAGSLILAKDLEGVQRMFKVTANISSSQNVVEGTNVERKKLEDLFDGIEEEIGDVDQELGSVKQALSNEVVTRQKYNVKNILNFNGTLTGSTEITSATAVTGYVGTVHINQGEEFVFVCTQNSALTSNTRNTLLIDAPSRNVNDRIYEDGATTSDYHNEAGLHIIRFTATQTGDYDFYLWTHTLSSAITYSKFMLCTKADYDADTTYRPYVPTNAQLLSADVNAELGAHNQLPISLDYLKSKNTSGSWSNNVYTITNLHITLNSNKTLTVDGTANSMVTFELCEVTGLKEVNLTGCPSGGSANTYYLQFYNKTDSQWGVSDYGSGKNETLNPSKTYIVYLVVRGQVAISPALTFKPMICLASDPSTKFTPYAMTNRELTDVAPQALTGKTGTLTVSSISVAEGTYAFSGSGYLTIADVMTVGKKHLIKVAVRQLYITPTTLSGEEGGTIRLNNKTPLQNINEVLGTSFTSLNSLNDTFKSAFRTYDDNNKRCVMTMSMSASGHYLQVYMPDGNGQFYVPNYVWWAWCE